jgi:hypothetical protein
MAFEAASELRVGCRRPRGVAIRMMAVQAILILCDTFMDLRCDFNRRAVYTQIMAVCAAAKKQKNGTANQNNL